MSRFLFAPVGIVSGIAAGLLAKKLFDVIWGRFSGQEAPRPDQREVPLAQLIGALAVEGVTFRVTKGLVDRGTRRGFARLTGEWPGEREPDPA